MTGQTGAGDILGQLDFERPMRIFVTGQTGIQIEVRFTAMTLSALGNNIQGKGRVTLVTLDAGHSILVSHTCFFNGFGSFQVTFDTIVTGQIPTALNGGRCSPAQQNQAAQHCQQQHQC
jgi:hypothetical protein